MTYWQNYGEFEGLEKVGEIELDEEPYSFNLLGVWKGGDGYYLGTDSGCSCPTPWQSYAKSDLTGPLNAEQAREEAWSLVENAREFQYGPGVTTAAVESFLEAVA